MALTPSRWQAVKAVFDQVADIPPDQRAARVDAAGLAPDQQAELASLLAHHDAQRTGFLAQPARPLTVADGAAATIPGVSGAMPPQAPGASPAQAPGASPAQAPGASPAQASGAPSPHGAAAPPPPAPADARAALLGQRLGPWQVSRVLGAGGMGEVFEARRADGHFEGRAAIKLLRADLGGAAVLRRFAHERQALARLNHPHIARLLDAGATDDGRPYFVMEYVDGRPLVEAALGLPLEQRLGLFLQLADAVGHAHRNLLVHRDLKPGNVLVDADGQVKLLDFGIAKALDPMHPAEALDGAQADPASLTQAGERPYTPNYASPEQVRGEPVTTATDLYSLGVLLYQMLTGTRPTGRRASTVAEAVKSVLEEPPTRPSRLSPTEALDPQWLATRRRLQGDLDNILLKALQKEPAQRYPSADALADDVRAYLHGRPVTARAASPAYVAAKFLRRNRWAALAAALGAIGLAGGLAATLLQGRMATALGLAGLAGGLTLALAQAQRAARSRDSAARRLADTKALLRSLVRQHADAITYLPGGPPAREAMLKDAAANLERLLQADPDDAEVAAMLAGTLSRLADLQGPGGAVSVVKPAEAEAHARRALELFDRLPGAGATDPEVAVWHDRAHSLRGRLAHEQGRLQDAVAGFEAGRAVLRQALQRWPAHIGLRRAMAARLGLIAQLHQTVGWRSLGRPDEAMRLMDESAAIYQALVAEANHRDDRLHLALLEGGRAVVHQTQERLGESLACMQRGCDITAALVAESAGDDTSLLHAHALNLNNLSYVQTRLGDEAASLASAEASFRACERLRRHDPDNRGWRQRWAVFGQGYAHSLVVLGRGDEALPLLRGFEAVWRDDLASAASPHNRQTAQRRLAMNQADQALALHAAGQADAACVPAWQAAEAMDALVQQQPQDRDLLLYQAEALAACAVAESGRAAHWRGRALQAYAQADALQPLQHDQRRARDALAAMG